MQSVGDLDGLEQHAEPGRCSASGYELAVTVCLAVRKADGADLGVVVTMRPVEARNGIHSAGQEDACAVVH